MFTNVSIFSGSKGFQWTQHPQSLPRPTKYNAQFKVTLIDKDTVEYFNDVVVNKYTTCIGK